MVLKNNGVTVYAADVTALDNLELFTSVYNLSSGERKEKCDKLKIKADKKRCLTAGLLLKYGLITAGVTDIPEKFSVYSNGKPCLNGNDVYFNISHSGKWAICAVSGFETGCDVEEILPNNLTVARTFSKKEREHIFSLSDSNERLNLFYRYWTLKESFMKAVGLGIALPLNNFQIILDKDISVKQSVNGKNWFFTEFSELDGCKCAVCNADENVPVNLKILPFSELADIKK